MTHQCHDCKNFTDGKCCHELKICLSNFAKSETQTDLSLKADSQFKVGDKVIRLDNESKHIYSIQKIENELITVVRRFRHKTYGFWVTNVELRHATPPEIKAGHRINFNLNDTIANAFDDIGDDKNIENHVAPQCVIGGDK